MTQNENLSNFMPWGTQEMTWNNICHIQTRQKFFICYNQTQGTTLLLKWKKELRVCNIFLPIEHLTSDDTTCERCTASYYCIGDGRRLECGCHNETMAAGNCTNTVTEHSFGAQSQCSSCPAGWVSLFIRSFVAHHGDGLLKKLLRR